MMQFGLKPLKPVKTAKPMVFWVKFDKFKVTQRRGGAIKQTSKVGHDWFTYATRPEVNHVDENGEFWVSTTTGKLSEEKPV